MDLSVVIVNWKVRGLLKQCLTSIYRETRDLDFEVWVVDNDSRDGSVEMVRTEFPQVRLIANERNLGFAAANNQAIRESRADFVLLLNPDTEIRENAFAKMVAYARANPRLGVLGPKMLNPDGKLQPSVRRFPTLASQLLILFKLHHLLPNLPALRRYSAAGFDYNHAQSCDQVMGAAFLISRALLDRIGPLDERYFVWFEEVDYCRQAVRAGFEVAYWPGASVVHHGSESFGQLFGPRRQRLFNASLRRYFLKNHGRAAWLALILAQPFSIFLVWLVEAVIGRRTPVGDRQPQTPAAIAGQACRLGLLFLILLEILSYCGHFLPVFSSAGFIVTVALAAIFAVIRPELAGLMLLAELFVGSQGGYLFAIGTASGTYFSLRMGLFLVVFLAWLARTVLALTGRFFGRRDARGLEWLAAMRQAGLLWPYLALLAAFAWGGLHGLLAGNDFGNVFFDANAYAYFALFPAFFEIFARRETVWRAVGLLAAAVLTTTAKALFTFFVFSHRMLYVAPSVYVWIRDTRVGEITRMVGDFYRVFFQSGLFVIVAVFTVALVLAYAASWRDRRALRWFALLIWSLLGIVLGLSRSFWFGLFCGGLDLAVCLWWGRAPRLVWRRLLVLAVVSFVGASLIIAATYAVPFPRKGAAFSLASLLGERALSLSGEAAANSRWALLPELWRTGMSHPLVGSGLGTVVTYRTSDPRLLADLPTGIYETYAFEWGYHDLWIKFGLLGLAAYGWLIWRLARPWLLELKRNRAGLAEPPGDGERQKKAAVAAGVLAGLVALIATNVFSPYLNHPLGIGIFMILGAVGWQRSWEEIE